MKKSLFWVFFALFVVVAGFYFYLSPVQRNIPKVEDMKSMRLLALDADDEVTLVRIQNLEGEKNITLQKEGEQWMITEPVRAAADPYLSEGLVSALTVSTKARRLTRERDWKEYGLENPKIKIGIETKKTENRRFLSLGDEAPTGRFVFARWEGEEDYFLVNSAIQKSFNKTVYTLRLKQVFSHTLGVIKKIRFQTSGEEYEIARHDEKWFWMEPIPLLGEVVDAENMENILLQIRDLYVKEFYEKQLTDKEEYGFSAFGKMIKVWHEEAEGAETLVLGKELPTRDAVYGMNERSKDFFLLSRSNVQALFYTVENIARKFLRKEVDSSSVLT